MLLATALTTAFDLQDKGVAVVGQLPAGLPQPGLPPLGDYAALLLPAAGVLLVGIHRQRADRPGVRDPRRVQHGRQPGVPRAGRANVGAGLFQGFPVSSSGSRTAIGESAGARTQLHSLVAVGCVIVVLLFLRPVLAYFPIAALGAIVIYAATRLVDLAGFRRLARFRRSELLLALVTLAGVLVFDILKGVLIAVVLSAAGDAASRCPAARRGPGNVPGVAGNA